MKFWHKIVMLVLAMMFCVSSALAGDSAAKIARQKADVREKVAETLEQLYEVKPKARRVIAKSEAYAVFANTDMQVLLFGHSHGRGMAINNRTGEEVFMQMNQVSAGLGMGAKEYAVIFVFGTQDAYKRFVDSGWNCNVQGTLTAKDDEDGGTYEGATWFGHEMWVYQLTTRGIMASVDIRGTQYYRNKKLSPKK